ncbi:MAG: DUF1461 domain-containing protein [Christensenellales bacterium]
MSKLLRAGLMLLLVFCLLVYLISGLSDKAVNETLMADKFARFSDTSIAGVAATEFPALASSITGYLGGKLQTPQVKVARGGVRADAFSDRELQHLADIRGLLEAAGILRVTAIGLVIFAFLLFISLRKARPGLLRGVHPERALTAALFCFLGLLALICIWGLIDFQSLFVMAHRLVFRNDLWQLDPTTDLLLQLMPLPLFLSYAADLLKQQAFLLLIVPLAAFGLRRGEKSADA